MSRITCPICNNSYLNLMSHVVRIHKLTKQQMIDDYGIIKFMDDDTHNKQLECLDKGRQTTWTDPELSKKCLDNLKRDHNQHQAALTRWNTPGYKEKMKVILSKAAKNDPNRSERLLSMLLAWQKDTEISAKRNSSQSEAMKKVWSDPNSHDPNLGFSYKKYSHTTWEGHNYTFKSSYEKELALILDDNKISYSYEVKTVKYNYNDEDHNYIIDFYLPEFDLHIEVKPECFVNDSRVQAKYNSAVENGLSIIFATENDIFYNSDLFLNQILELRQTV